jgi:hypothetical protein
MFDDKKMQIAVSYYNWKMYVNLSHLIENVRYPRSAVEIVHLHPLCGAALAIHTVRHTGSELRQKS